ncbi:hypothetical protein [Rhizobium ruizarguesonis]|uniref:hypothetical protein n=1 Tax=Rhizobium ruizarguesonis TaxID=2081791 RepID=UPI0010316A3F|nr:hypothetical protein [Rhizobium ruizarguesonis]TBC13014.1 hypothetical protein ELH35_34315 [Rhizobium ruizarguesonis]
MRSSIRWRANGATIPGAISAARTEVPRTLDTNADTLGAYEEGPSLQAAIDLFWRYQLAELQSLLTPARH